MADGLQLKYFVLKPRGDGIHAKASREALRAYARAILPVEPVLATQLCEWADRESLIANGAEPPETLA